MTKWTEEETNILIQKIDAGWTINEISKADLIPGRSYDAIRKRFSRIDREWPPLWTAKEDNILKKTIKKELKLSRKELIELTGIERTMEQLKHRLEYLSNEMD